MAVSTDCIFCKIGRGEIPSEKVFDDATAFAIHDINPKAPVHLLLIPYAHVGMLADASDDELAAAAHCFEVAPAVAQQAGLIPGGYRLVVNQGRDSGQEVGHFHLHVLGGRPLGPIG